MKHLLLLSLAAMIAGCVSNDPSSYGLDTPTMPTSIDEVAPDIPTIDASSFKIPDMSITFDPFQFLK